MKKIIKMFIVIVIIVGIIKTPFAYAATNNTVSGSCGYNVEYSFNTSTGEVTIYSTGEYNESQMYDYTSGNNGAHSPFYCDFRVKSVTIKDGVKTIGRALFYGCYNLTNVAISNRVQSIGSEAFRNCCLKEIDIPSSVRIIYGFAFYSCPLTDIVLPNGVTKLYESAFSNCKKIKEISIPSSVEYIGSNCFNQCDALTRINIEDLKSWCSITFEKNANPLNVTPNIYINESLIEELIIPDDVYSIGNYAFQNGKNIKSVKLHADLKKIGNWAFEGCDSITSVSYNNSVEIWNTKFGIDKKLFDKAHICCNDGVICNNPDYDNGVITTAPQCTKSGIKTYTCTICGKTKTESIPATGLHTYDCVTTNLPICTDCGIKTYTCTVCGSSYTESVDALGHNYVKTITKATPKKNGKIVTKCSRCGDSNTKTVYAPKYVELNANTFEYDGKVKTPKVVVYDSKDEIVNKSNYTVTYSKGRKKLGTYTVTVKFKGNYSGTVKKTFRIAPKRVKVSSIKVKAASTEEISVSWGKVKGVDGYEIYRWNDKKEKYKFYKKTTKTSIKINRDSKKYNDVYFAIRTYKKVGKKTHKSVFTHEYGWVKLSAPSFKVEQEDFNEFTLIFSHEDRYDIQISNNKNFANSDSDRTKNRWTKSYREYCKKLCFGNAKSNKKYYVRARKYYYNKKGKLVVGPWSKVTVVKPY